MEPVKTCSKCGTSKPLDEFYTSRRSRDGRTSRCRTCVIADVRTRHQARRQDPHRPRCTAPECPDATYVGDLCIKHWQRSYRHGSIADPRPTAEERFWAKVDKGGPVPDYRPDLGPCWLWLAGCNQLGYGRFSIGGRFVVAHRVSFEWVNGPVPSGKELDHLCRVRDCCRPSHLELVTHRENILRGHAARRR